MKILYLTLPFFFLIQHQLLAQAPQERYQDYDPIADFYNDYWGEPLKRLAISNLDQILLKELNEGDAILDLMCGTAQITQELKQKGFQMTGLDASSEMLKFAKKNAPGVRFILEDARYFDLDKSFDAVTCMSDGLNHVMEYKDLKQIFTNVYKTIKPGGYFVFDMNLEARYLDAWNARSGVNNEKYTCFFTSSYQKDTRKGYINFTLFTPKNKEENSWEKHEWQLSQYCYTHEQIVGALKNAGFGKIDHYDAEKDLGSQRNIGRTYYVAQKK